MLHRLRTNYEPYSFLPNDSRERITNRSRASNLLQPSKRPNLKSYPRATFTLLPEGFTPRSVHRLGNATRIWIPSVYRGPNL